MHRFPRLPGRSLERSEHPLAWVSIVLVAALVAGGSSCRDATISGPLATPRATGIDVRLTLEFRRQPEGIDPRAVEVVFESVVLDEPQRFDWEYISTHDEVLSRVGDLDRYLPNEATTPDLAPPLKQPLIVKFSMPSKPEVKVPSSTQVSLESTLYWGGRKMDSAARGLFLSYQ